MFSSCQTTPSTDNNPVGLTVEEMTEILTSQKWRYDYPKIKAALDSIKSQIDPTTFSIVSAGPERVKFGIFEFAPNNVLWLDLNNGTDRLQGTWKFGPEGKLLVVTFSNSKANPQEIVKFSKEEIYLAAQPGLGAYYPKIFVPLSEGAGLPQSDPSQETPKDTVQ
jgi:hypothetical protein